MSTTQSGSKSGMSTIQSCMSTTSQSGRRSENRSSKKQKMGRAGSALRDTEKVGSFRRENEKVGSFRRDSEKDSVNKDVVYGIREKRGKDEKR